jgi:aconitase A
MGRRSLRTSGKVYMKVKADLKEFDVQLRVDTPQEVLYYEHGGSCSIC